MYCHTPECDCRRVMLQVTSDIDMKPHAVVNFGWESRGFYAEWFGEDRKDVIDDLRGPCLNVLSPQSRYAEEILKVVKVVLNDKSYVERLKKHYQLFKEIIYKKPRHELSEIRMFKKYCVSRNAPCPCGSGKKYKKCCGV